MEEQQEAEVETTARRSRQPGPSGFSSRNAPDDPNDLWACTSEAIHGKGSPPRLKGLFRQLVDGLVPAKPANSRSGSHHCPTGPKGERSVSLLGEPGERNDSQRSKGDGNSRPVAESMRVLAGKPPNLNR